MPPAIDPQRCARSVVNEAACGFMRDGGARRAPNMSPVGQKHRPSTGANRAARKAIFHTKGSEACQINKYEIIELIVFSKFDQFTGLFKGEI